MAEVNTAEQYGLVGYYAAAAIPARFALERAAWAEAAALDAGEDALRLHRCDDALRARRRCGAKRTTPRRSAPTSQRLADLRTALLDAKDEYWALQVEIQHRVARAWIAFAEGRRDEAVALLQETATMEDGTDKSAVSPGPLAPAREMLGDMLLEMKRPADALKELEAVMKKEPNRFRTLYLAAKAASSHGRRESRARSTASSSSRCVPKGDAADRPELAEMKKAGQ